MGAMQRNKGSRGEREVVNLLRKYGFRTTRTAPLQTAAARGALDPQQVSSADVTCEGLPGVHLEIKRAERVLIEAWCRQAEADAGSNVPVVVWRRSRQPWRVTLTLEDFLNLVTKREDV